MRKAAALAALLACVSGILPTRAVLAAESGTEVQRSGGHKWRDAAACAFSMLLPMEMRAITVRTCALAYAAWIE